MKKLALGVAVSAALFGGMAQAAVTLDGSGKVVVTPADTYEIYLSGASAALDYIEKLSTSTTVTPAERMCDSTQPVFKFKDNGSGKDQNAYLCTLNPLNPQLVGLAGGKTNLMIYKRSAGGSAMGVAPIIDDAKGAATAAIAFLNVDPAICTVPSPAPAAGVLSTSTCTYSEATAGQFQVKIPDFGISDVDPEQFRGVNTPAGFSPVNPSDIGLMNVDSAGGQVFGIGATLKLRNALQEAEFGVASGCVGSETEACMPSLTRDQVASIITGKLDSWNDLKIGATGLLAATTIAANKPAGGVKTDRVHICTRTDGSGTKAQMGINFLNYPCSSAATSPTADTGALSEIVAKTQVHANSSSGTLSECLRELDSGLNTVGTAFNNTYGTRWAVGIQGLEKNADQTEDWRFIKIDNVAPTLENVAKGKYHDWAELTFQYSKTHVFDAGEKTIVDEFIKAASNPAVLVTLNAGNVHPFGASGYLASPKNYAPEINGQFAATYPVNPFSHATTSQGVNNCRIPATYDLKTGGIQLK
ncbi:MAG: hypothetical protein M0R33_06530 [Methylomonas sp.]|uniref:hypothetical protein n=1 Tax=Methylomonas sp. TaxID=418 RepID=UPI0025E097A4|nr:hypothetical protein [Methylomonas sp.]MCK9606093.1 hypothetical protein [Methylomonas sp.]